MKPILFSTPMVRAILAGNKTQTRRVINPQPKCDFLSHMRILDKGIVKALANGPDYPDGPEDEVIARFQPGDILWVRETWDIDSGDPWDGDDGCCTCSFIYRADYDLSPENAPCLDTNGEVDDVFPYDVRWRPSIHMPRVAARIFLRVTDVRVERVKDISDDDCFAEGISETEWYDNAEHLHSAEGHLSGFSIERFAYATLWDKLNAKRGYGWDKNPWVWVYTFEPITKEEAEDGQP